MTDPHDALQPPCTHHDEYPFDPEVVAGSAIADTCANGKELTPLRQKGRAQAKIFAREAAAETCGAPAVGRSIGLTDSAGKALCSPAHSLPVTVGDALIAEPHWAEAYFMQCLSFAQKRLRKLEEKRPSLLAALSVERLQRHLSAQSGTFASTLEKALADDRITREEARELLTPLRQLRRVVDELVIKLEALL